MNQCILRRRILPKEPMNRLKGFQNVLKGVPALPDLNNLMGSRNEVPFCQGIEKGNEIQVEGRGANGLNQGHRRLQIFRDKNVPNKL